MPRVLCRQPVWPAAAARRTTTTPHSTPRAAPQLAVQTHVDASRARAAMLRASMDLGRLEMRAKDFGAAQGVLEAALAVAKDKEGEESEAAGARAGDAWQGAGWG